LVNKRAKTKDIILIMDSEQIETQRLDVDEIADND
jgi:hypothetical protein